MRYARMSPAAAVPGNEEPRLSDEQMACVEAATNASAIALYARCGFQNSGARRSLPHSPAVDMLRMVRDLL